MKEVNKKVFNSIFALGTIAGAISMPTVVALTNIKLDIDSSISLESSNIMTAPTNLIVTQGSNEGEITIQWDTIDILNTKSIVYFAIQDTLFEGSGWKIYSSAQTKYVTLKEDLSSATIIDDNYITQGNTYNVSIGIDVDPTDTTAIEYFEDTPWSNWNETTLGIHFEVVVTNSVSGFATPTNPPSIGSTIDSIIVTSPESISFTISYDNGSLEFNPNFIVTLVDVDTNNITIDTKDLNVVFTSSTLTTIEILRLTPGTQYETISVDASWSQDNVTIPFNYSTNPITISTSTDVAPSSLVVGALIQVWNSTWADITIDIGGNDIANVVEPTTANIVITNLNNPVETVDLTTVTLPPLAFIWTHTFELGGNNGTVFTSFDNIGIDVLAVGETDGEPISLNNTIIDDEINIKGAPSIVTYSLNGINADASISNPLTSLEAVTGSQNGEIDINWEIDYPQGITLSQLGFKVEVLTTKPTWDDDNFIDVTDQTSNFGASIKSATISGLSGPSYVEGVWVRVTIDYLTISYDGTESGVTTAIAVLPKIPTNPNNPSSGLSTGALIGIIVGSVAGAILIGLGAFFIIKKKNSLDKPDADDKVVSE